MKNLWIKRALFMTVAICIAVALCGCSGSTIYSNYREVENLEVIRVVGIDEKDGGVTITAASGVGLDQSPPKIFARDGESISFALYSLQNNPVGKEPYFSHTENILIGQSKAESGIAGVLDYVERSTDMRLDTNIFVVKGEKAQEIVLGAAGEETGAADMLAFIEKDADKIGVGHVFTCGEVAASMASAGNALIMAIEPAETELISGGGGESMIKVSGYAVFENDKMVGFVDSQAAKGATMLMGYTKYIPVIVDAEEGTPVSLGITEIKTEFKPVYEDGQLENVNIKIEVMADIAEVDDKSSLSSEKARREKARLVSEKLYDNVEKAIEQSQKLEIDYMGLRDKVQMAEPEKFTNIRSKWNDIFKDIDFNISISTRLERTFDLNDPVSVNGEGNQSE